jgi:hypothetical protein
MGSESGTACNKPKEGAIMSRTGRIFAVLVGLAAGAGTGPLLAQSGGAGGGLGLYGYGPRLGENVQLALELRDQLGLSEEQIASLRDLQEGIQRDVGPLQAEIDQLRAHIISGEVNRLDGLLTLEQLLAESQEVAAPYRAGVTTILTTDQHLRLQEIMWNTRPGPDTGWGLGMESIPGPPPAAAYGPGVGARAYGGLGLGLGVRAYGGRGLGRGLGLWGGRGLGRGPRAFYGRGLGRGYGLGRGWRWD